MILTKYALGFCSYVDWFDRIKSVYQRASIVIQWLVAELAILLVIRAASPCVEPFAGEPLVQVEAFVPLGTPVEKVKLAELPHLWRVRIVGVKAFLRGSWAFSSHESVARFVGLPRHLLYLSRLVLSPLQFPISLMPLPFSFLVLSSRRRRRRRTGSRIRRLGIL